MEQKITFERLIEFNNAAQLYMTRNVGERSQVSHALDKLLRFYQKPLVKMQEELQSEINEACEDIRVQYCEKEKDTGILKEKTYGEGKDMIVRKVFTAENQRKADKEIKAKTKEIQETWLKKPISEFKYHIVPVPPQMEIAWIEAFSEFIFEPMTEEQLEAHYLAQAKKEEPVSINGQG